MSFTSTDRIDSPEGWRRRGGSFALALLLELSLLALLLTLGKGIASKPEKSVAMTTVNFAPEPSPSDSPKTPETQARKSPLLPAAPPVSAPADRPSPVLPVPMPPPAAIIPVAPPTPTPGAQAVPKIGVRLRDDASGPAGSAGISMSGDSQVVGTGPQGQPLYAARWYREPSQGELRGYLSTVAEPGWALINCRTAPQWRVEDCYLIDQYPDPGTMGRAVLAAAWQFQVRPPVKGGKSMVGEWVRIRISLTRDRS